MNADRDRAATSQEFWAGAASGSSRKMLARAQRWLEGPRPSRIMVNYQTMLNGRDSRWRDYNLFIDPGAYSMFAPPEKGGQGLAEYPESTESYLYDIGQIQPTRYAWRDYVCEDDVREFHDWTVEKQQERTLDRHIECANLHEDLGITAEPVAVVQGWKPADYRRHAQQLRDHGLVTERLGIGTMCGRDDTGVCEEIVAAVREVLPDVELHAFGLDKRCYDSEFIIDEITSTDSLAYCYRYQRPAGWTRWEYIFKLYLDHRAAWDNAVGGAEFQSRENRDRGQSSLEGFA
ncbi:deazapurine DNA modification protein DpdA family protein [Halosimplex sp. J119]